MPNPSMSGDSSECAEMSALERSVQCITCQPETTTSGGGGDRYGPHCPGILEQAGRDIQGAKALPTEVLLLVVDSLVSRATLNWSDWIAQPFFVGGVIEERKRQELMQGLTNLALVCRAWHHILAPHLYRTFCVNDATFSTARILLRSPTSSFGQHAQQLRVRSSNPMVVTTALSKLLRGVFAVVWDFDSPVPMPCCHPAILRNLYRGLSNVVHLELRRHRFWSSSDLLHLLYCLPSLQSVFLVDVSANRVSTPNTGTVPCKEGNRVLDIFYATCSSKLVCALLSVYLWPRPSPTGCSHDTFPGIEPLDLRVISDVLQLLDHLDKHATHHVALRPCVDKQTCQSPFRAPVTLF